MDTAARRRLKSAVLKWYDGHGRKLPWRESADPYRIWLSEIMLQQTTVAAVVPYFERFTGRFPDVESLASANVDEVLRLWEGLGYYSRARNLHKAAQAIVNEHSGRFPTDVKSLQTLPGIGRYTAGAIASFAFDLPAAIVEANTERLYARLLAIQNDVRSTASQRALWEFAESIVPQARAGDFNQALMDIGATICRPQDPDCQKCPLVSCCETFRQGLQSVVPVRKARTAITAVSELGVILQARGKVLLRRRTARERWAGMWDFIRFEIDDTDVTALPFAQSLRHQTKASRSRASRSNTSPGAGGKQIVHSSPDVVAEKSLFSAEGDTLPKSVVSRIKTQAGLNAGSILASMEFSYSVTRYKVRLLCFLCETVGKSEKTAEERAWFSVEELIDLPMSGTGRQIARWLKVQPLR